MGCFKFLFLCFSIPTNNLLIVIVSQQLWNPQTVGLLATLHILPCTPTCICEIENAVEREKHVHGRNGEVVDKAMDEVKNLLLVKQTSEEVDRRHDD